MTDLPPNALPASVNSDATSPAHGPEPASPAERRLSRRRRRRRHRRRKDAGHVASVAESSPEVTPNRNVVEAGVPPAMPVAAPSVTPPLSAPAIPAAFDRVVPVSPVEEPTRPSDRRPAADNFEWKRPAPKTTGQPFVRALVAEDGSIRNRMKTRQKLGWKYLLREVFD